MCQFQSPHSFLHIFSLSITTFTNSTFSYFQSITFPSFKFTISYLKYVYNGLLFTASCLEGERAGGSSPRVTLQVHALHQTSSSSYFLYFSLLNFTLISFSDPVYLFEKLLSHLFLSLTFNHQALLSSLPVSYSFIEYLIFRISLWIKSKYESPFLTSFPCSRPVG